MSDWSADEAGFLTEIARRPAARAPATIGEIWGSEWKRGGLDTIGGLAQPSTDALSELSTAIETAAGKPIVEYAAEHGVRLSGGVSIDWDAAELGRLADTLPDEHRKRVEPLKDVRLNAARKAQKIEADANDVANSTYGLSGHAVAFIAGVARQAVDPVNLGAMVATAPFGGEGGAGIAAFARVVGREALANAGAQAAVEPAVENTRADLGLDAGFGRAAGNILEAGIGGGVLSGLFHVAGRGVRALRGERPAAESVQSVAPEGRVATPAPETRTGESASAPERPFDPPPAGALAPSRPVEQFAPEDFTAAAHLAERDQIIDIMSPTDTAAGRVDHAAAVENRVARIDGAAPSEKPEQSAGFTPSQMRRLLSEEDEQIVNMWHHVNEPIPAEASELFRNNIATMRRDLARDGFDKARTEDELRDLLLDRRLSGVQPTATKPETVDVEIAAGPKIAAARKPVDPNDVVTQEIKPKAARGRAAADPKTWSLFEYLAANGGLAPHSELDAIFGGKKGPFVPGFGPLIRKNGRTLDDAFRLAKEGGYAFDAADVTGAQLTKNFNELLRMIDEQQAGRRQYRQEHLQETKIDDAEEAHQIIGALEQELFETGGGNVHVDPELADRVVQIVKREGETDLLSAYERAIMEDAERYEGLAAARSKDAELAKIPGWDVDDAGAAPRDGAADPQQRGQAERAGQADVGNDGEAARDAGGGDRAARQLGDPALAADAQRAMAEAGGDLDITLQNPDGTTRTLKASEALREVEDDARAADELNACISNGDEEIPF
ncbi:hypothetical protein ASC80_01770 [Afipia sp. Root123D2]|uniref:hypothetical protein n=1 Tax=Afipia sp. Root123D2 TaxID=1736436 RepID=UPI0006FE4172|nr:hypothetical protein [Afipia sp. Root123D2]KQW22151.1 hypothetical protein ASC80_01770 [Afipia sp. Root123D2]